MKVLVTTKHKGVFYGELASEPGTTVTLTGCRNAVAWGQATHGFLGLAAVGPDTGCRIGPPAPRVTLFDVTSISTATAQAESAWEVATW